MIVSKFGGSSLSSQTQFNKVKQIIHTDPQRCVVVVSALGKRQADDNKLTDMLYLIAAHIKHGVNYDHLWDVITDRFVAIKNELHLTYDIESELDGIKKGLMSEKIDSDFLVSRGEYLTAKLMAEYLGFEFIDAKNIIVFHAQGSIDLDACRSNVQSALTHLKTKSSFKGAVIPGFYGAYTSGKIKLLNRGGSDITAAVVARCLEADKYENWTDVNGVLMADPRIVDHPVTVPQLSYEELSELSYMGASVLHEETIYPIRDLQIPIHIMNTNAPDAAGTVVSDAAGETMPSIKGISGKKDYVSINIFKYSMSTEVGFLHRVLEIFERYKINIEHTPTGIDHVGIIVAQQEVEDHLEELIEHLQSVLGAEVTSNTLSLITVVGSGIVADAAVCATAFTALGFESIKIQMISMSPRGVNMVMGVENEHFEKAINALYQAFVNKSP